MPMRLFLSHWPRPDDSAGWFTESRLPLELVSALMWRKGRRDFRNIRPGFDDGRWAAGGGRRATGDGRRAMGDGRWAMGDGDGDGRRPPVGGWSCAEPSSAVNAPLPLLHSHLGRSYYGRVKRKEI